MPLVNSASASPYPTINQIMEAARTRVNDTALDIDGELLANDQPYSETLLNLAWSWWKDKCAISGIERPIRTVDIYGVPASAGLGQYRSWINWFGCSDGVNQYESPTLPNDLFLPLNVKRRISGGTGCYTDMTQANNGLPNWYDPSVYDWSDDGLYFYGTAEPQDFQIRYSADLARLIIANVNDSVPFVGCERAISARLAYEYANRLGSVQAPVMAQLADDEFSMISQRTGRKNQRRNIRRQPYARLSQY